MSASVIESNTYAPRVGREQSVIARTESAQEAAHVPTELYRHFDAKGRLLYVGISLSTMARTKQHKDGSHWFSEIRRIEIEVLPSRHEALAAERVAILKESPIHNIQRPSAKGIAAFEAREAELEWQHSNGSRRDLVKRLVQFNPLYSIQSAATALGVSVGTLQKVINDGKLGYVEILGKKKITGWQIIDYLEALAANAA